MRKTGRFFAPLWAGLVGVCAITLAGNALADIGAEHEALVSEFASFNTPGVVDGRVEAIADAAALSSFHTGWPLLWQRHRCC